MSNGRTVAIIPARGGSKGIPRKNLVAFCGRPLIAWSILQARAAPGIDSVWVSSDAVEILEVSEALGAHPIRRPDELAGDTASSESAWLHALDVIGEAGLTVGRVVGMQATSPLREPRDLGEALEKFDAQALDSLLSVVEISDFFVWERQLGGTFLPVNYDFRDRRRRQAIAPKFRENGSFYVFRPQLLHDEGSRLGGRIGAHVMEPHKMFQIDSPEDLKLCEVIMRGYGMDHL